MWKRSWNPAYKSEINRLIREIKENVKVIRNENWVQKIVEISEDPKKLWRTVKNLKNKNWTEFNVCKELIIHKTLLIFCI